MEQPLVTLGLIIFKSKPYLRQCFESLMALEYPHVEILVADHDPQGGEGKWLKQQYPDIQLFEFDNPGFAGGHNRLIRASKGKYYACLNVDMVFEPHWLTTLVKVLEAHDRIGAVGGKILKGRWKKEGDERLLVDREAATLDTAGLQLFRSHRVVDRGQGEADKGQYDLEEDVFGISGASVVFRKKALEDVAISWKGQQEYFDEQMFMYKEDVDLSYRLQLADWRVRYVPTAVNWHDRTLGKRWWKSKRLRERYWSYLHHLLIVQKYWRLMNWRTRLAVLWYELRKACFILVLDPKTCGRVWRAYRSQCSELVEKAALIPVRHSVDAWYS